MLTFDWEVDELADMDELSAPFSLSDPPSPLRPALLPGRCAQRESARNLPVGNRNKACVLRKSYC